MDVFIKYAWIKPLADKKTKTVLLSFIEIKKKSKLWFDQGEMMMF